jgi:hypothetical protein
MNQLTPGHRRRCNIRNGLTLQLLATISEHLYTTYLPENYRRNIFRKGTLNRMGFVCYTPVLPRGGFLGGPVVVRDPSVVFRHTLGIQQRVHMVHLNMPRHPLALFLLHP